MALTTAPTPAAGGYMYIAWTVAGTTLPQFACCGYSAVAGLGNLGVSTGPYPCGYITGATPPATLHVAAETPSP